MVPGCVPPGGSGLRGSTAFTVLLAVCVFADMLAVRVFTEVLAAAAETK